MAHPQVSQQAQLGAQIENKASSERQEDRKRIILLSSAAAVAASLCCLTPFVLVLLGLASVSTAVSLDDLLSGQYAWAFRLGALVLGAVALVVYFRGRGVCTLDEARRQRNRIVNVALLTVLLGTAGYITLNYILLEYLGAAVGLPWAMEGWALPAALSAFGASGLLYWIARRHRHG